MKNTTAEFVRDAHEFLEGFDRHQFRGRLKFLDLLGSQLKLSYDWFRIDAIGLGAEFKVIPQKTRPFFRQYDPNTDFEPGNFIASVDHPDGSLSEAHTVAANWHDDFGEWGVDFVAGHSILNLDADLDLDYSPAPAAAMDAPTATAALDQAFAKAATELVLWTSRTIADQSYATPAAPKGPARGKTTRG